MRWISKPSAGAEPRVFNFHPFFNPAGFFSLRGTRPFLWRSSWDGYFAQRANVSLFKSSFQHRRAIATRSLLLTMSLTKRETCCGLCPIGLTQTCAMSLRRQPLSPAICWIAVAGSGGTSTSTNKIIPLTLIARFGFWIKLIIARAISGVQKFGSGIRSMEPVRFHTTRR